MLTVEYTNQFKRDFKLAKRRNRHLSALRFIMRRIENEEPLHEQLRDHPLMGNWIGHRELHVEPDWLLIYKLLSDMNAVIFVRTGSHSDLF